MKGSVSALQSAIKRNNEQLDSMRNEQDYMSFRLRKLEEEIEKQERYSRRSNMLLYGMKEETGESFNRCATRVLQVLCRHFRKKPGKRQILKERTAWDPHPVRLIDHAP